MRKSFQRWLFLFIIIAFFITFIASLYIQTKQSKENAIDLISVKMNDAKQQIQINNDNVQTIREITDATAIAKAHIFAKIIELDKSLLNNDEKLEEILKALDVDELHISNENGILIQSIPSEYEGYDMSSQKQSSEFMLAIGNKDFELVQEPQAKGINGDIFQYAGVSRLDDLGIVQIGYKPERLQQAMEIANIENLAIGFRIGNGGSIIVCKDNKIISIDNQEYIGTNINEYGNFPTNLLNTSFDVKINDEKYIGISNQVGDYVLIGLLPQQEMYFNRNTIAMFLLLCNIIVFAVVFIAVSWLVQRIVISGIQKVNKSLDKISKGDLDEKVSVSSNEEFKSLSNGINAMVDTLKKLINAEKTRIDNELKFARQIQLSSLPNQFPPYPDRKEFEIYATIYTAKEVGGDFYDFFLVDDDNLAILIADVSGKGIPASLFMMNVKTLIKSLTSTGMSLEDVFYEANTRLCENNDAGMFVTVWMGILQISTGKLTFVNAGHNKPLIKRANSGYEYINSNTNFILAGMENIKFKAQQMQLYVGDKIYLYTDGVTEALNTNKELFGETELKNTLNSFNEKTSVTQTLIDIKKRLDIFMGTEEQADDITMLALEYMGDNKNMDEITVSANIENLNEVLEFIRNSLQENNCELKTQMQIEVAVEEIFVNIANYAYNPDVGNTTIRCEISKDPLQVIIQFLDSGKQYNPLNLKTPDISLDADERQIGGLGVFMVKQNMDSIDYEYIDGKNILTIKKKI